MEGKWKKETMQSNWLLIPFLKDEASVRPIREGITKTASKIWGIAKTSHRNIEKAKIQFGWRKRKDRFGMPLCFDFYEADLQERSLISFLIHPQARKKFKSASRRSQDARNEYFMSLRATNAHQAEYYTQGIPFLAKVHWYLFSHLSSCLSNLSFFFFLSLFPFLFFGFLENWWKFLWDFAEPSHVLCDPRKTELLWNPEIDG